jgi:hypothetical protein
VKNYRVEFFVPSRRQIEVKLLRKIKNKKYFPTSKVLPCCKGANK